jgi:hypothetical protein
VPAALCVAAALAAGVRPAAGAGSGWGSYTVAGATFTFDLANEGATALQSFTLVGPPGTAFLGGATAGESTAPCTVGQPDGGANEIQCGPLAAAGLAPGAQLLFVGTMQTAAACGQPFELEVAAAGATSPTAVAEIALAGACAATPPPATGCTPAGWGEPAVVRAHLAWLDRLADAFGRARATVEAGGPAGRAASRARDAGGSPPLTAAALRGVHAVAAGAARALRQASQPPPARCPAEAIAAARRALYSTRGRSWRAPSSSFRPGQREGAS